jgi:hypothetical protein
MIRGLRPEGELSKKTVAIKTGISIGFNIIWNNSRSNPIASRSQHTMIQKNKYIFFLVTVACLLALVYINVGFTPK